MVLFANEPWTSVPLNAVVQFVRVFPFISVWNVLSISIQAPLDAEIVFPVRCTASYAHPTTTALPEALAIESPDTFT